MPRLLRFSRRVDPHRSFLTAVTMVLVVFVLFNLVLGPLVAPGVGAAPVAQIEPPVAPPLPPLPPPPDVPACAPPLQTQIPEVECETWVDFYNHMGGPNWISTLAGNRP